MSEANKKKKKEVGHHVYVAIFMCARLCGRYDFVQ